MLIAEHVSKCGCRWYWCETINCGFWAFVGESIISNDEDVTWQLHYEHEDMLRKNKVDPTRVSAGHCMVAQRVGYGNR